MSTTASIRRHYHYYPSGPRSRWTFVPAKVQYEEDIEDARRRREDRNEALAAKNPSADIDIMKQLERDARATSAFAAEFSSRMQARTNSALTMH